MHDKPSEIILEMSKETAHKRTQSIQKRITNELEKTGRRNDG